MILVKNRLHARDFFLEFFVEVFVSGENLQAKEVQEIAVYVGNAAAGFFDDQYSRGHIPRFQVEFPVAVEAAARYVYQIYR